MALLPVAEGGKRDRREARHQVDLHHSAVDDHENDDRQDGRAYLHDKALQEESQERSEFHGFQRVLYRFQGGCVNGRAAGDKAPAGIDHMLRHVEDRHDDIESVGDQHDRHESFEDPLEEDPCFKVCQVVVFDDQLDQLIAGDERKEQARNGNDDCFGDVPDEAEHCRREVRRSVPNLGGHVRHLAVDGIEHAGEVIHDAVNEHSLEPVRDLLQDSFQGRLPPSDHPNRPDRRGTRVIPMRATPPPAINCFIPWDFAPGLSLP